MTHVQSIFDPSTRHQSIKLYDECQPPVLSNGYGHHHHHYETSKKTCILKKVAAPRKSYNEEPPLTVAGVVGASTISEYKSKPISIKVGSGSTKGSSSPHSPLLRNGFNFSSSSAPSHYFNANSFGGRGQATNGHQTSNSEEEDSVFSVINGHPSPSKEQEQQSRLAKEVVNGNSNNNSSATTAKGSKQQQPAPILVAGR